MARKADAQGVSRVGRAGPGSSKRSLAALRANAKVERRPEQAFFDDPALDRAVGMIMTLATELAVTQDRLRALERILEKKQLLDPDALDRYEPGRQEAERLKAERDAFVAALMESVLGLQKSKGPF